MSRPGKAFSVIFLVAAAVRLTLVFGFHHYEFGHPEPVRIAISLAARGSFADPYVIPTGPTAHTAPIYPALIAPLYAVWGDTRRADMARVSLNALAASAEYALLPLVASALGLGVWTGILAGLGGALIPLQLWPECMGEFETTWVALFLEVAAIRFARFLRTPRIGAKHALRGGLFWGVGFLIAPNVLPVLLGFVAIGAWKLRPGAAAAGRWATVFAAGALAVSAPWLIRNYVQLGDIFFVRDDLGLELSVSNSDGASPLSEVNFTRPNFAAAHPQLSVAAAREIRRTGEAAFERRKLRQALDWIRSNPGKFASLTAARAWSFWFPRVPRFRLVFWTAAAAAFASLALMRAGSKKPTAALVLGTVLGTYSAVYCVVQNTLRYEHPLWWIQVLLMGWTANLVLGRWQLNPRNGRERADPNSPNSHIPDTIKISGQD